MKVQHYLCPTIEVPLIDGSGGPEDGQTGAPGEQQEMPDLAAAELGITEEALMEALGVSAGGPPTNQS